MGLGFFGFKLIFFYLFFVINFSEKIKFSRAFLLFISKRLLSNGNSRSGKLSIWPFEKQIGKKRKYGGKLAKKRKEFHCYNIQKGNL